MGEGKRKVVPGEFLAGAEEAIPGNSAYLDKDEIYSAAYGEVHEKDRVVEVVCDNARKIETVRPGMELYCMVRKMSATKAFLDCTPATDINKSGSTMGISAVLPVQNVKRSYVRELRDELRTGDILKARISKIERDGVDVSIGDAEYGVIRAFCTNCRNSMVLKSGVLICSNCGRKENRKLSSEYPASK